MKLKYVAIILVCFISGTAYGLGATPDIETIKTIFSQASQSQIAQTGFFFTLAAWIHAGQVKKEISKNFEALTMAIDKVADAFREDLKAQGARLDNLSVRVQSLESETITSHTGASNA